MEVPVYLFTGFLEAGKTKCIQETMESEEFNTGEKILIIQCECGEEELDFTKFPNNNISVLEIYDKNKLTKSVLSKAYKEHKPQMVLVEYNGMWQIDDLYNSMPDDWFVYQELFMVDSSTFISYNNNMRSLIVDKLKSCELVVFNRADSLTQDKKDEFHKIIRGTSRKTTILYEYADGSTEYDETEDPLPYDIDADIIEIDDRDFAIWYRDFSEDEEKYYGKTVRIKGVIGTKGLPSDVCVFGRYIMTCCIDDVEFKGFICHLPKGSVLKNKSWVYVTAEIKKEYCEFYEGDGPVLYAKKIELTSKPEEEIATFF